VVQEGSNLKVLFEPVSVDLLIIVGAGKNVVQEGGNLKVLRVTYG
jgi:hypothetical protein